SPHPNSRPDSAPQHRERLSRRNAALSVLSPRYVSARAPPQPTPPRCLRPPLWARNRVPDPHLLGWFRSLCEQQPRLSNKFRTNLLLGLRRLLEDLAANGHPLS